MLAAALMLSGGALAGCTPAVSFTSSLGQSVSAEPKSADADAEGEGAGKDKKFTPETPDNAKFLALKQQASTRPRQAGTNGTGAASPNPVILRNVGGQSDPGWSPPDWNGAIGPSRYLEVINNRIGFYNSSLGLLSSDTTFHLAATTSTYLSDPEIVYDPATSKFYFAMMEQDSAGNWHLDFGFSKIQQPSSVRDFCHYSLNYGLEEPDYPRLGGTKDFLLIGVNIYGAGVGYTDSRVQWARKPGTASLTTCPAMPANGVQYGEPFTPVPAHQTDPSAVGYVMASSFAGGNTLTSQQVTKATNGTPVFATPITYTVLPYTMPANAPQPGTLDLLNTFDSRLYQVVQSYDPRLATGVLWTSLTTFAGAGSGVEWFELTVGGTVAQQGVLSDTSRYIFNGTIAPDRAYSSSTVKKFGSNMGLSVTTASASQYASMAVATKRGTSALSPLVTVKAGTGPITCGGVCRWGDRSSANAALPASTTLTTGRIYVSNGWAAGAYRSQNVQMSP